MQGTGKQKIGAMVNFVAFYIIAIPAALMLGFKLDLGVEVRAHLGAPSMGLSHMGHLSQHECKSRRLLLHCNNIISAQ